MKKKVILITACAIASLLVITGSVAAFFAIKQDAPVEFEYNPPEYDSDLKGGDFKAAFSKYGSRTEPQKVYVSDAEELGLNEIPTEQISIYRYRHAYYLKYVYGEENIYDSQSLKDFANATVNGMAEFLKKNDDTEPEYKEYSGHRLKADIGKYSLNFKQYPFYYELEVRKFESYKNQVMILGDKRLVFSSSYSDEEITESLTKQKEALFAMLGCNFEDIKVVRHYSENDNAAKYITVYFYNEKDNAINKYAPPQNNATFEEHEKIGFYSDYISIVFSYAELGKTAIATTIKYVKFRTPPQEIFPVVYTADMISLQAAEGMLFNNQFFSGNVCVLCAGEEINVTEYDYVSFEYLAGNGFRNNYDTYVLPFYVFYVKEEDGERYDTYSKYYVPAIRFKNDYDYWTTPYDYYYEEHQQHKTEESEDDVYG